MLRRHVLLALAAGVLGCAAAASADNLLFVPLPPCRVIDTRVFGAGGALVAGTPRSFFFRGPTRDYQTSPNQGGSTTGCGIPDLTSDVSPFQNIAKAVAINIVAVGPAGAGDLRAWPANQSVPTASVINYAAVSGLNIANGIILPMCDEVSATPCSIGDITFRADVSGVQLVVDVVGYFHAGSPTYTVRNTALGHLALQANTTGNTNTASGYRALFSNTIGNSNTASGYRALYNNASDLNTATGYMALPANTTGKGNTANGSQALYSNTAGNINTASGYRALDHSTGSSNIGLGAYAGGVLTTGSNNIDIGSPGVAGESNTIRIGTPGTHTAAFIAGIEGQATGLPLAIPVLIDAAGQLGTISSSIRFKEDVHDLGAVSDRVLALRPVSFRYKKPFANGMKPLQYGLIAEEVEKVLPELVAYGKDGKPETVLYHVLPTLLLAELEKEHSRSLAQGAALARANAGLAEQRATIAALARRVEELERQAAALQRR